MDCWACSTQVSAGDNYCRECGASLRAQTLPALLPERRVVQWPYAAVPAVLVGGMTALALGQAGQWVLRKAAGKLVSNLLASGARALQPGKEQQSLSSPTRGSLPPGTYRIATFVQQWVQVFEVKPSKTAAKPSPKRGLFGRG